MSSHNPKHPPESDAGSRDKTELLDELESIKDLLDESEHNAEHPEASLDDDELDIDVPILDDVVPGSEADNSGAGGNLLDLKSIFEEEEAGPGSAAGNIEAAADMDFEGLDMDVEIPSFKLAVEDDGPATDTREPASAEPAPVSVPDTPELATDETLATDEDPATGGEPATVEDASAAEVPPAPSPSPSPEPEPEPEELEWVIQELVDEMIPVLEDRLRQRLSQYSETAMRQLAARYLKH